MKTEINIPSCKCRSYFVILLELIKFIIIFYIGFSIGKFNAQNKIPTDFVDYHKIG